MMLENCSNFLTEKQTQDFVRKLNYANPITLYAEWELAILYGLNHLGKVKHEPKIGGSKPDIHWTLPKPNGFWPFNKRVILAEITSVTDIGLEKENPREYYSEELGRRVKAKGFNPICFYDYPEGELIGPFGKQKMKLKYPKVFEAERLFNKNFYNFLDEIKINSLPTHQIRLGGPKQDIDVSIFYNSKSKYGGGGNPAYTVYYSKAKNPIINCLKEKHKQLKKTRFKGPMGIFLTDGGCNAIQSDFKDFTGRTHSEEDVVWDFLRKTTSVSFVMTLFVKWPLHPFTGFSKKTFQGKIFRNPKAKYQLTSDDYEKLSNLHQYFPKPKLTALNASRRLTSGWETPDKSNYTSTMVRHMKNDDLEFSFSARAFLDMLAGKLSQKEFIEMHNTSNTGSNIFRKILENGNIIKNAKIKRLDEDDDNLILVFGPDVSAGPYSVPLKK